MSSLARKSVLAMTMEVETMSCVSLVEIKLTNSESGLNL